MERMRITSTVWCTEAIEGGIRDGWQQIGQENTTPLVDNLEIGSIFEDKAKEGGDSVIDLIMQVCQLLR